MESHGDVRFAAPAKLATSSAASGNLPVRGGAGRHWNDKGALRMMFGMRVRGGLFAALIMFAVPVAATLAAVLVSALVMLVSVSFSAPSWRMTIHHSGPL